ncbi:MAG: PQQ-dependent sugar dehydrogenase [Saprospiraceae bacterium]|nr:PQQ-dependent sugar dehydrogenase [Saprospiraceae bacterium]MDW8484443.1 PQQ-dependent sugar dehydrogenase [Saprospiraceae bacterium]
MKYFLASLFVSIKAVVLTAQPKIALQPFATGFNRPVDIAHCGDSRLFIVEQRGMIWALDSMGNRLDTFLNIMTRVRSTANEQGLLGLAFAPDYAQSRHFYVNYTRQPDGATVISRFSVLPDRPNRADAASEQILLVQPQPYNNHNGGCIKFGPDGHLYIGLGDGGSGGDPQNFAQNPSSLLGKTLRIDVRNAPPGQPYGIPPDNPFLNNPAFRPEIWSLGWRNHWRFSFDRLTGDFWAGDVGQNAREEIDFEPAGTGGRNYGWRCYEGTLPYNTSGCAPASAYTAPIFEYANPTLGRSVTGGFVYRGSRHPAMYGYYLFADYVSGRWWATRQVAPDSFITTTLGVFTPTQISTFGEDQAGELYVAALSQGTVYRILERCSNFQVTLQVVQQPKCFDTTDGVVAARVSGGTAPYSFLWSDSNTSDSIRTRLLPGVYAVEIRDAIGCIRRDTLTLTPVENPPPGLAVVLDSSGVLRISEGTWIAYQWKRNNIPIPGATEPTYKPSQGGYYSCLVTSPNQCQYEPGKLVTGIFSTLSPEDIETFGLYPNPAPGYTRLHLKLKQPSVVNWTITDAAGRTLRHGQLAGQTIEELLPLGNIAAGLYYFQLSTSTGTIVRTLIVEQ